MLNLSQDLFEHLAIHYLSDIDVGRLAQCNKGLNEKVSKLSHLFWIHQFKENKFSLPKGLHHGWKWMEFEKNAHSARLIFVFFKFISINNNLLNPNLTDTQSLPPSIYYGEGNPQLIAKWYPNLCDSDKKITIAMLEHDYLFDEFFFHLSLLGEVEEVRKLIHLVPSDILNGFLQSISQKDIAQVYLENGADPKAIPCFLHNFLSKIRNTDGKIPESLPLLVDAGARMTELNSEGLTPLGLLLREDPSLFKIPDLIAYLGQWDKPTLKHHLFKILLESRSLSILQTLKELGVYTPCEMIEGCSALHHMVKAFVNKPQLIILRQLLEWGENPNFIDDQGLVPLHYLIDKCIHGSDLSGLLTLFDSFGADFKLVPYLLHRICNMGHLGVNMRHEDIGTLELSIRLLLQKGFSVHEKDDRGKVPMYYLFSNDYRHFKKESIITFIEAGESLSSITDVQIRFYFSCTLGDKEWILKMPESFYQNITPKPFWVFDGKTLISAGLAAALGRGHFDIVKHLLKMGGNNAIDFYDSTSPLNAIADIEPREERSVIAHSVFNCSKSNDKREWIVKLIMTDYPLFLELIEKMDATSKEKFLEQYKDQIIEKAFIHKIDVFQLMKGNASISCKTVLKLIETENDVERILQICNQYQFLCTTHENKTLFEHICKGLRKKNTSEKYLKIFFPLFKVIQELPINKRKNAFGCPLSAFFEIESDFMCEDLSNVYDVLFSVKLRFNTLHALYSRPEIIASQWYEIKRRLALLKPDFSETLGNVRGLNLTPLNILMKSHSKTYLGHKEVIKDMIRFACENKGTWTFNSIPPLHHAVTISNPEEIPSSLFLVDELLSLGLRVDEKDCNGKTALLLAIEKENPEAAHKLLDVGAKAETRHFEAACRKGYLHLAARMSKNSRLLGNLGI